MFLCFCRQADWRAWLVCRWLQGRPAPRHCSTLTDWVRPAPNTPGRFTITYNTEDSVRTSKNGQVYNRLITNKL